MSTIAWKQINRDLSNDANFTGSFRLTGSFFLDDEEIRDLVGNSITSGGLFQQTGSYYSTANNLQITGSFSLGLDGVEDTFDIKVGGQSKIQVNNEGTLVLFAQETPPTAVTGGIYYDINNSFYLGQ